MLQRNNKTLSMFVALGILSTTINADVLSELTIQSSNPKLYFDDTGYGGGSQWMINTYVSSPSLSRWKLNDLLHYGKTVIEVNGGDYSDNSIKISSSGDVALAGTSVFIKRDTKRVGIGAIYSPEADLHVGGNGDIILDDGSKWKLGNWGQDAAGTVGFSIEDMDNSSHPLKIENNATTDTLYLATDLKVGIGTNDPKANLHIASLAGGENNVSIRLETDTVDWSLESTKNIVKGFIIKDNINNTIPFIIENNTSANLLKLAKDSVIVGGNILATFSGSNTVDDGLTNLLLLSANNDTGATSDAGFGLRNDKEDFQWNFRTGENGEAFIATKAGNGGADFQVLSGTSYKDAEVRFGGVTVFKNGHLVNKSGHEITKLIDEQGEKLADARAEVKAVKAALETKNAEMIALKADYNTKLAAQNKKIAQLETMRNRLAQVESLLTNLALNTSNTKKEKVSLNK